MPYKIDSEFRLEGTANDLRVKITEEMKETIRFLHSQGVSIRQIARTIKISPRSVQFILFPERVVANKARRAERGGSKIYYVKEEHKESMKKYRRRKFKLFKEKTNV